MSDERVKLTNAQRKVLEHVARNSGRLYGSRRDFPSTVCRRDVLYRVWFAGLIVPPSMTDTRTWELTPAGCAALNPPAPVQEGEDHG